MTELEAYTKLVRAGIASPDATLVARLIAAAAQMQAGLARQPQGLPTGLEPAASFSVPLP
ncbi:hypothetical protein JMJ56_25400 [Belnapia sp. T18]|uniref:DUF4089 domain-containing protein n=1 Tax=Belnapia arida TaxID=2804533 RepID=A0ABS1U9I7_9PROT|nr:hypothetical protein [Belnapia arida]MBL6081336.1 hypothetical protein [Belnapia arida]